MPIYEYRCQSCAQVSSIFFKVASAATDVNCEHCGDYGMERHHVFLLTWQDRGRYLPGP